MKYVRIMGRTASTDASKEITKTCIILGLKYKVLYALELKTKLTT